ncbi:hypothetical protein LEG80045_24000 [Legionella pneumophila]|nr:hypothetical protein LEG80045_24000 [Legionella pneumophila]
MFLEKRDNFFNYIRGGEQRGYHLDDGCDIRSSEITLKATYATALKSSRPPVSSI